MNALVVELLIFVGAFVLVLTFAPVFGNWLVVRSERRAIAAHMRRIRSPFYIPSKRRKW